MANAIAARRLRKSMLEKNKIDSIGIINSIIDKKNNIKDEYSFLDDYDNNNNKIKLKTKLVVKLFISILIVFVSLTLKLIYPNIVNENIYINRLANEYKKDCSKNDFLNAIEDISYSIYDNAKFFIPEKMITSIQTSYITNLKPNILEFTVSNSFERFFEAIGKKYDVIETMNNENVEICNYYENKEEQELIEASSLNTSINPNVNEILSKKISIIKPVDGVITSRYGDRDKIFENVNPYHTGIDIANLLNTEIKSSTLGIVKKVIYEDKYYGNYVEIQTEGVVFKYAHLNEISVKENDSINQGDIIGKMGSTGMSTGSHLHFEIKINGESVNPEEIMEF